MKATYGEVIENGEVVPKNIYKDPKTDSGFKKSAKGLLKIEQDEATGEYKLLTEVSSDEESEGCLETVFLDGKLYRETSLGEIRTRIEKHK